MSELVYEAAVHAQKLSYKNFKNEIKEAELFFALDPLNLLQVMSTYSPKKIKSGNPALNGKDAEFTDEDQIKMVRRLAVMAAGQPSDDGDSWIPWEDFEQSIAGKAFLTKLVTSDEDRREFADVVILAPFKAFCKYFDADTGNSESEKKEMKDILVKMERIFKVPEPGSESPEERKARLQRELAQISNDAPSE